MILRAMLVGALFAGAFAYSAKETIDRTGLEGTWALHALEVNGEKVAIKDFKSGNVGLKARLVIDKERYVFYLGKDRLDFTYKTCPTVRPSQIDLIVSSGAHKGKTHHGIYKVEGGTYTICRHVDPEKPRPTAFATTPKSGLMMVVWKRVKP